MKQNNTLDCLDFIKLTVHQKLIEYSISILNAVVNDNVISVNGEEWETYDHEMIEIKDKIPYKNDFIDGILFFGDACVEFHLENEQDALNWVEFPTDVALQVLIKLQKQYNLK